MRKVDSISSLSLPQTIVLDYAIVADDLEVKNQIDTSCGKRDILCGPFASLFPFCLLKLNVRMELDGFAQDEFEPNFSLPVVLCTRSISIDERVV